MVDNSLQVWTVEIAEVIQNNGSRFTSIALCRSMLRSFFEGSQERFNLAYMNTWFVPLHYFGNLCFCCCFIFLVNTCQKRIPMYLLFEFFSVGFHRHSSSPPRLKQQVPRGNLKWNAFPVPNLQTKISYIFLMESALCHGLRVFSFLPCWSTSRKILFFMATNVKRNSVKSLNLKIIRPSK